MTELVSILQKHKLRFTKPRKDVFTALSNTSHPLSLGALSKLCPSVDRSSVYRVIDTYIEIGVVKVVHIGWKKLYELTDLFLPHHHHFRCEKCETLFPVTDDDLEQAIEAVSRRYGFQPSAHHFEIEGVCKDCQPVKS